MNSKSDPENQKDKSAGPPPPLDDRTTQLERLADSFHTRAKRVRVAARYHLLGIFVALISMTVLVVVLPPLINVAEELFLERLGMQVSRYDFQHETRRQAIEVGEKSKQLQDLLDAAEDNYSYVTEAVSQPLGAFQPEFLTAPAWVGKHVVLDIASISGRDIAVGYHYQSDAPGRQDHKPLLATRSAETGDWSFVAHWPRETTGQISQIVPFADNAAVLGEFGFGIDGFGQQKLVKFSLEPSETSEYTFDQSIFVSEIHGSPDGTQIIAHAFELEEDSFSFSDEATPLIVKPDNAYLLRFQSGTWPRRTYLSPKNHSDKRPWNVIKTAWRQDGLHVFFRDQDNYKPIWHAYKTADLLKPVEREVYGDFSIGTVLGFGPTSSENPATALYVTHQNNTVGRMEGAATLVQITPRTEASVSSTFIDADIDLAPQYSQAFRGSQSLKSPKIFSASGKLLFSGARSSGLFWLNARNDLLSLLPPPEPDTTYNQEIALEVTREDRQARYRAFVTPHDIADLPFLASPPLQVRQLGNQAVALLTSPLNSIPNAFRHNFDQPPFLFVQHKAKPIEVPARKPEIDALLSGLTASLQDREGKEDSGGASGGGEKVAARYAIDAGDRYLSKYLAPLAEITTSQWLFPTGVLQLADEHNYMADIWRRTWQEREKAATILARLRQADQAGSSWQNISSMAARLAIVALLIYLVNILVNLYRYNMRLAAYYEARSDAIKTALASGADLSIMIGDSLVDLAKSHTPEDVSFGARPAPPTEAILTAVQDLATKLK